ncbi:SprT-like family-domain-containing protein [Neurospora tetraspora]|uniref:SprT-like family-domain-containing protein n=1 Tax=Neurospora tetraspora TaxID=94610 RepID=A0AAE0JHA5_9PEZI|nr:SprT-like family-domain-containing protein [Neurospora tetraspora]
MARLSRPPPSSRSRKTIFSSSSESESDSNNDSNSDSDFPDLAALPPSPKKKRKVSPPLPATKKRPTPPTDTASISGNQTVVESATSPNAASSSVAGIKRRKLLLGAVSDNVLFRKWTPAQEEDAVPTRKKRRDLTAGTGFGLRLGMMRDEDEDEDGDSEAENPVVLNRKKVKEVKRVGESTVTAKTVVRRTTKSLFSSQTTLSKKHREGEDMVGTKNEEKKPSASLFRPPKQVAGKSKDMMEIDQEQDMDVFEDLEDFAEESFHTAQSKESSESDEVGSETTVGKGRDTNTASNSKDDDSDEDLDAFFSKLSNKPKTPAVRESHLSPTKPRSTKNSRGKRMDTSWESQSRTLFDEEESDGRRERIGKRAASSEEDSCGEEDVTQDFSCLQLESSSSSSDSSSETETERRSRPPAAAAAGTRKRTQTPSPPPPKIPRLKPKTSATLPPSPKKLPRIPTTPHRPSSDLFWSREFVDDWNDEHSPKKELFPSSTKPPSSEEATNSPDKKKKPARRAQPSPQKAAALLARESRLARQAFDAHKHSLATHFLALLDARLTSSRLSALTASTGGIKLVWSKTLNTTAGRANWKKESITTRPSSEQDANKEVKHHASIELATKVLSTPERLFNTLAHEFCHLAVFMIDGVTTRPHGAEFKAWARKVNDSEFGRRHRGGPKPFGKMNIIREGEGEGEGGGDSSGKVEVEWEGGYAVEVTTRHGYEIEFRYVWVCDGVVNPPGSGSATAAGQGGEEGKGEGKGEEGKDKKGGCGTEYKRHSKSVDPKRHRCGVCKGVLRQVKPAPRGQGQQGGGGKTSSSSSSAGGGFDGDGSQGGMGTNKIKVEKAKTSSEYQVFVKEQMKVVKAQKPGLAFGEVMKEVAERWKVEKARREKKNKKEITPPAETTGKLSTVLEEVVADEEDGDGEDSPDMFEDEPMMDVVDLTADD